MITNEFYTLKELLLKVKKKPALKYRQIQKRLKIVLKQYENQPDKLFKKSNRWYIHFSLLNEFERDRTSIDYKLFITIAAQNKTDESYWRIIIRQINKNLLRINNSYRIKYVIENTNNYRHHLHFITDFTDVKAMKEIFKSIPELTYLNKINVDFTLVYDIEPLQEYFKKQNKPVLFPCRA